MSADASGSAGAYDSYHQEQHQAIQEPHDLHDRRQESHTHIQYHHLHEQPPGQHEQRHEPEHHDNSFALHPDASSSHPIRTKECSVRGCTQLLPLSTPNKMCELCRGRHRIYASTKRARRKLEKAAVVNAVKAREALETQGEQGTEQEQWQQPQMQQTHPSSQEHNHEQTAHHEHLNQSLHNSGSGMLSTATWEHAIDPRLFSTPDPASSPSSASINLVPAHMHQHLPRPHSITSELANALTLPKPPPPAPISPVTSTPSSSALVSSAPILPPPLSSASQNPYTRYFRVGEHAPRPPQPTRADDEIEEREVLASLQSVDSSSLLAHAQVESSTQPQAQVPAAPSSNATSTSNENEPQANSSSGGANEEHGESAVDPDTPARYCSVKGCKNVIPGSYAYKMCPTCRTRYRTYGITKRAKWKLEREAFDREMMALRNVEDEKRKARGEKPLAECPDEMREWELSIIDEQVPLPQSVLTTLAAKTGGSTGSPALPGQTVLEGADPESVQLIKQGAPGQVVYLPSAIDTPLSHSPYPHVNNPLLMGSHPPLPARMCTVSHCHKILPGFYRYKRCEQHRLQNRYHSKLKRVREKVVKAEGPAEHADAVGIPEGFAEGSGFVMEDGGAGAGERQANGGEKEKKVRKKRTKKVQEVEEAIDGSANGTPKSQLFTSEPKELGKQPISGIVFSHSVKLPHDTCASAECQNLLAPGIRWWNCEDCRTKERRKRFYVNQVQKAARGEKLDTLPAHLVEGQGEVTVGMVTAVQHPQMVNGQGQDMCEHQQGQPSHDKNAEEEQESEDEEDEDDDVDMDALAADVDAGHDDHNEYAFDDNDRSPQTGLSDKDTSASASAGPSRSSTNTPSIPTLSSATKPVTPISSTANLVTLNDPLAFRAYKPQSTTSAIGRIIAKNPHLSVDAFTDLLLPNNTQIEGAVRTAATQHSAPGPIHTPTIPTSTPFVYQPPSIKQNIGETNSSNTEPNSTFGSTSTLSESATYHYRWRHSPAAATMGSTSISAPTTTATATATMSPAPAAMAPAPATMAPAPTAMTPAPAATAPAPAATAPAAAPVEPTQEKMKVKRKSRAKEKPAPSAVPDPTAQGAYGYPPHMPPQYPYPYYMPSPYGMPPYGMPPPPSGASSSSSYLAPLPYPYQPYGYQPMPPPGYSYMHPQYMPSPYGQPSTGYPPISGSVPPGTYPPGTYPLPPAGTYPPPPGTYSAPPAPGIYPVTYAPTSSTNVLSTAPASTKPTTRKFSHKDIAPVEPTKFGGFSHYLNPEEYAKKKRRKVVDGWQELYQQSQPRAASIASSASTAEGTTLLSAPVAAQEPEASTNLLGVPHADASSQEGDDLEQSQTRKCVNKTCHRVIPLSSTICAKCKLKFKKHQTKAKQRFKLEPRKSLARPSQNREPGQNNQTVHGMVDNTPESSESSCVE